MRQAYAVGTGCPKCHQTADNARTAAAALGIEIALVTVDRPAEIAKLGVMFTPALAVDGQVKVAGRLPNPDEIKAWLRT